MFLIPRYYNTHQKGQAVNKQTRKETLGITPYNVMAPQ